MTPIGSFHGSNRLTCTMSGSCGRTPYCRMISSTNGRGSSRFFTESGSMHGGANTMRSMRHASRARTAASSTPTRRTARRTAGRTPRRCGFASVRSMWQRQIHFVLVGRDALVARVVAHRRGLRVVHHDVVPLAFELQRVVEHALEVDALHLRRPLDVGALQRVVHGLGDREELVAAVDHLPLGVDADIAEQRDVGGEQLGDAAAVRGRVDVQHPGAARAARRARGSVRASRARRRRRSRRGACRAAARVRATDLLRRQRAGEAVNLCDVCPSSTDLAPPCRRVSRQVPRHAARRRGRGRDGGRASRGPASTTSSSCRSPTAARERSTRLLAARGGSRRVGARDRSARRSGRRGVGRVAGGRRDHRDGARERPRARVRPQRSAAREHARHRRADRGRAPRRASSACSSRSAGARRPTAGSPRSRRSAGRCRAWR